MHVTVPDNDYAGRHIPDHPGKEDEAVDRDENRRFRRTAVPRPQEPCQGLFHSGVHCSIQRRRHAGGVPLHISTKLCSRRRGCCPVVLHAGRRQTTKPASQ